MSEACPYDKPCGLSTAPASACDWSPRQLLARYPRRARWPRRAASFSSLAHWTEVRVADIETALSSHGLLVGVNGELPENCRGVADDSRKVERGELFIAVRG